MSIPAVFLDRDNTLIHNDGDLGDPAQVELIQGVPSAIASLRGLGYAIIVVTNQGGVARGAYDEKDVDRVHQRINELIKSTTAARIDRFYYCPYHPEGTVDRYKREHPWRKPAPGMLLQAAKDMDIDMSQSWMIGDQLRDVQAGEAAGVRTIILDPQSPVHAPYKAGQHEGDPTGFSAHSLIEATRIIAQQRMPDAMDDEHGLSRSDTQGIKRHKIFRPWNAPVPPEEDDSDLPARVEPAPVVTSPVIVTPPVAAASAGSPPQAPQHKPVVNGTEANLLKQILHELRAQRGVGSEFAYTKMLAVVLQMLALVCFVGAFWMSGDDGDMFIRWIASAMMVQLATVAMLLFGR